MPHTIIEFSDKYVRVDEIDLIIACLIIINLNRSIIAVNGVSTEFGPYRAVRTFVDF